MSSALEYAPHDEWRLKGPHPKRLSATEGPGAPVTAEQSALRGDGRRFWEVAHFQSHGVGPAPCGAMHMVRHPNQGPRASHV